jgi:glycosyltransferase involved in cell wall biosynthesis
MRVLYFIDSLVPAGAERSLSALAPHYARLGVRLDVAYLVEGAGLHMELQAAGASLHSIAGQGRMGRLYRGEQLVRRQHPDIVHTTLFEADVVGRIAGAVCRTPVVSSLVNVAYGPEQLRDRNLRRWKVRGAHLTDMATAQLVSRFHANSKSVADVMGHRLLISGRRIEIVPRGRDPEELGTRTADRRARTRRILGVDAGEILILAIARQEHQKGLDLVLRALSAMRIRYPQAKLVVAGREGNQSAYLRELLDRLDLGEAVRFLGPRRDIPDLLCAADVFVSPSRWEGFPGVLLEAMALEAPIVATDLKPVREVVGDEIAARLVPEERPDLLAEALLMTLDNPDEAKQRTRAARERFLTRFTIDRIAERMVALYDRMLSPARR